MLSPVIYLTFPPKLAQWKNHWKQKFKIQFQDTRALIIIVDLFSILSKIQNELEGFFIGG